MYFSQILFATDMEWETTVYLLIWKSNNSSEDNIMTTSDHICILNVTCCQSCLYSELQHGIMSRKGCDTCEITTCLEINKKIKRGKG